MKTTFKITALLILVIIIGAGRTVLAEEKTKKYHESWSASSVETLDISNKFGEVKFKNEGGTEITIDVLVTVEASSASKATELLNMIDVDFSKTGTTVKAVTSIENNFKSQREFSINYEINVPSDKNLIVSNKYGNTVVNKLNASGDFDIQYGNITANELTAPANGKMNIMLAYGKGNIETTGNANIDIKYSNISLGTINDLILESKYSSVEFDKGHIVQIESKYDKFDFGKVKSVTANTKYSQLKIGYLASSLKIETGYGGIKVAEIAPDFESVSISNSYGQISLGLNNASYTVDANCEYCGISYPEERFKGNRMKENTSYELKGKVGTAGGGNVVVKSRYGEIKLDE
ncbi:MAG TPA: hypothetical protein VLQ91_15275 [Draconibacterium sp.]|nr:hypothetical protein [Draconibacterium sp.]